MEGSLKVTDKRLLPFVLFSCRLLTTQYFPFLLLIFGITVIMSSLPNCISCEYQSNTGLVLIQRR